MNNAIEKQNLVDKANSYQANEGFVGGYSESDPASYVGEYGEVTSRQTQLSSGVPIRVSLLTFIAFDACFAMLICMLAFEWTPWDFSDSQHVSSFVFAPIVAAGLVMFAQIFGLHDTRRLPGIWGLTYKITFAVGLAVLLANLITMLVFYERVGRYISLITAVGCVCGLFTFRMLVRYFFSSRNPRKIAFLGSNEFGSQASKRIKAAEVNFFEAQPVPESVDNLAEWLTDQRIDELVTDRSCSRLTSSDVVHCNAAGIRVYTYSEFVEYSFLRVEVDDLAAPWFVSVQLQSSHSGSYPLVKRGFDIVASFISLILAAPVMAIAVVLIQMESGGSAIYRQSRVGFLGKEFTIYKLRSMADGAEVDGARWAQKDDPRVTKVGRFIRRTRIDELPQLWNVLCGEMSLVGPRPERPVFVQQFNNSIPFYEHRHVVKPGITGWAQINYPYGASERDAYNKLSYDLFYVKHLSPGLDIRIVLRTIGSLVVGAR